MTTEDGKRECSGPTGVHAWSIANDDLVQECLWCAATRQVSYDIEEQDPMTGPELYETILNLNGSTGGGSMINPSRTLEVCIRAGDTYWTIYGNELDRETPYIAVIGTPVEGPKPVGFKDTALPEDGKAVVRLSSWTIASEVEEKDREIERLKARFDAYGNHLTSCPVSIYKACDCGFGDAWIATFPSERSGKP